MENEELTMLPVSAIYPHPDNPRKDVGDVTELADSIKKRGILQNLTVMPGHWLTMDEMAAVVEAYTEDPTDELKELIETKWSDEGYTTLIGHRRTAAAKLAGISEAPCRIVYGLTKNEQISMMLEGDISAYSLYKTPERSEIEFQDGSRQITEYYNLFARKPTQEDDVRIENNASLDEFSEWIEEKELEEDYPELPEGMTALEIGISDSASITSQEDTSAIYQITIKLTYLKER